MESELATYILNARNGGLSDSQIKTQLAQVGWQSEAINQAFQTPNPQSMPIVARELPPDLRGWNWGAFLLSVIWAVNHRTWLGILTLIPGVGLIIPFILGAKGNEWAWKNRTFSSANEFKLVQKKWSQWGVIVSLICIICIGISTTYVVFSLSTPASSYKSSNTQKDITQLPINLSRQNDLELLSQALSNDRDLNESSSFISTKGATISLNTANNVLISNKNIQNYLSKRGILKIKDNAIVMPSYEKFPYTYSSDGNKYTLKATQTNGDTIVKIFTINENKEKNFINP